MFRAWINVLWEFIRYLRLWLLCVYVHVETAASFSWSLFWVSANTRFISTGERFCFDAQREISSTPSGSTSPVPESAENVAPSSEANAGQPQQANADPTPEQSLAAKKVRSCVIVFLTWTPEGFFQGGPIVNFSNGNQKELPMRGQQWWNFTNSKLRE